MFLKYTAPQRIRLPSVHNLLATLYSPDIVPNSLEREFVSSSQTNRSMKIAHKLKILENDRLRWSMVPFSSKLSFACMRNRYRRRWTAAFAEALRLNGFDNHGRKLPTSSGQGYGLRMTGTLEVRMMGLIYAEDRTLDQMVQQSDKIVKGLEKYLSKNSHRSVAQRSWKPPFRR